MTGLQEVAVPPLAPVRLRPLIGEERFEELQSAGIRTRTVLDGHTVWNVNSTATGGGVAEMLLVLVGYTRGADLDVRWVVMHGDEHFFEITKRIHNRVHGVRGDDGALGATEAEHYERVTRANAADLCRQVRPHDVVLLHDPQTAGLCDPLRELGAHVVWRCHIGIDSQNETSAEAWSFLLPYVTNADAFVFSRRAYVPAGLPADRVEVIPPSIDPFSPKNRALERPARDEVLGRIGLFETGPHPAIVGDGALDPSIPLVVQVSRWDHLKDMRGVMTGFAHGVVGAVEANLALVGPSVAGVADDPEGATVLDECIAAWHALPARARARIRLVSLPMADVTENATMVNAMQRFSTVVVQKSIAEGFGLTVAEAMWKAKPVVGSRVGGIADQVTPESGVLLDDPTDLDAFARSLTSLLQRPADIERLGRNAHARVSDNFVGDRHLRRYAALIERRVTGVRPSPDRPG